MLEIIAFAMNVEKNGLIKMAQYCICGYTVSYDDYNDVPEVTSCEKCESDE